MAKRRVEEHLQSHLRETWHRMLSNMQEEGDMLHIQIFNGVFTLYRTRFVTGDKALHAYAIVRQVSRIV